FFHVGLRNAGAVVIDVDGEFAINLLDGNTRALAVGDGVFGYIPERALHSDRAAAQGKTADLLVNHVPAHIGQILAYGRNQRAGIDETGSFMDGLFARERTSVDSTICSMSSSVS